MQVYVEIIVGGLPYEKINKYVLADVAYSLHRSRYLLWRFIPYDSQQCEAAVS
jgi:hypothetical protein